jgi:SAM-dependent methyltransferase
MSALDRTVPTAPTAPQSPIFTNDAVRTRLQEHFAHSDPSVHPSRWDDLWKTQDFLPWDRGTYSPALADVLTQRRDLLGDPTVIDDSTGVKRRKRALVPGCGKGYDVLLLASFGYDSYGVEASAYAVKACEKYAEEAVEGYMARDPAVGSGSVKFLYGDFFKDEWVGEVDGGLGEGFDVIYDYTVGLEHAMGFGVWIAHLCWHSFYVRYLLHFAPLGRRDNRSSSLPQVA